MRTLVLLFSLAASASWAQDKVTVKYDDLLGIQESLNVTDVTFDKIVKGNMDAWAIRLLVHAESACGKELMVMDDAKGLKFYQIGPLGPHAQPGCDEVIEYFWSPDGFHQPLNKGMPQTLKLATNYGNGAPIQVQATVTHRTGAFDGGFGNYSDYSDVKVIKPTTK